MGELLYRSLLLVDDDAPNLDVLSAVLDSDYQVFTAESGVEAIKVLDSHPIDVIITDQRMPEMTGVEFLERAGESHPDVAGIVLTAYTDTPAIIEAINRAGAFRFLTKPWDADTIKVTVAQASSHVYQRRAIARLVDLVSLRNEELALALQELNDAQERMLHLERVGTIGRLTAGVTHDIRNFLMGLALLEEECATGDVSEDLQDTVRVSLAGLRNLLVSLDAMKEYSKDGKVELNLRDVSPKDIVKDALTVARMDIEFRKRSVEVNIEDDLPAVMADHQRLVQVMVNLIRNAVQATEQGQSIVIEAKAGDDGGVRLVVEDEGKGIPIDIRDELFDAFSTTKGEEGMGMGLYMARMTVESHGGTINYRDRPEGGTRFEITFNSRGRN
ncbi:MAG: hybrid sensor histidine kinase/response regulator [Deltaproteobacteria bacterium]|nr:hybrid sensor histidine kinase/response regulator [Deltaproteobacteria bacterium]